MEYVETETETETKTTTIEQINIFYMMLICYAYLRILGMEHRQTLIELNKTSSNFQTNTKVFFETLYVDKKLTYIIDANWVEYPTKVSLEEMVYLNNKIHNLYNSILVGNASASASASAEVSI